MRRAGVSPEPHLSAGQNSHTPGRVESRLNFPLYLFVYNMLILLCAKGEDVIFAAYCVNCTGLRAGCTFVRIYL